ncbi:MAG: phosphoribosylaminoimidazolesuccinocarboxamide synthase, partial [Desulfovibrionaceae bacterium]|nr:phosphoribosylaminoimidazolesuccinocarboxamide synthase [Desulfovibrionaceae bacterium]
MQVVTVTALPGLGQPQRDLVRDVYELPQKKQLVIRTDRMAVSGQILKKPVPYKGIMFTQITLYWINKFNHLVGHNLVAQSIQRFPSAFQEHAALLKGRSVIVQQLRDLPLKFRVVGNLAGADWAAYQANRIVGGKTLRLGMVESARLENPV